MTAAGHCIMMKRVVDVGLSKIAPKSTELFSIVKIFLRKYLLYFVNDG